MANVRPKNFFSRWAWRKLAASSNRQATESPSAEPAAENPNTDADDELDRLALRALFREPQFTTRDGLDDYDGDYTFFEARGDLLTQDMLRALERTEKLRADAANIETNDDPATESGVAGPC